jgi:hypothetical protein
LSLCLSDNTNFWFMASVAVCRDCDTNWRPSGHVAVRSLSSIDFDDEADIDDFITELFGSIPDRTDRTSDSEVDVLVRFAGPDKPPPPDFHRIILAGLAQAIPGVLLFWKDGGTPPEFCARVPVAREQTDNEVAERVRSVLAPWPAWEVAGVAEPDAGDTV